MKPLAKPPDVLGRKIVGVSVTNFDGYHADGITITFDDGHKLRIFNEYIEGFGWSKLGIQYELV